MALRRIFSEISNLKKPIVLHNGLLDLMFVCNNFVNPLPNTLEKFVACIVATFPPIYDTKYIAEFHMKEKRSYLEYIFKKSERANKKTKKMETNIFQ